ncbi:MAG TPA: DUF1802 family protein [Nitrososphaera sp.]|jgi:hypothetical protein
MMQALKEWAVVCKALEQGRQVVLLRKGGILEYRQGFEVKHDKFLMFPTYEHQSKDHLQPDYADEIENVLADNPPGGTNRLTSYAKVIDVKETSDRSLLQKLARFHIWNESYVNARMDYNAKKPMSVILLRVFKLDTPIHVDVREEWAGCKSWIPLDIDAAGAQPALDDIQFERVAAEVREVLSIAA